MCIRITHTPPGGPPRVGLGSGGKEHGIICGLRTDCREGPRLDSGRTVGDGRHVSQGRDGEELGLKKGCSLHNGLHMG